MNRKRKVSRTRHGLVLHNHIDVYIGVGDFTQDCIGDAWLVGHAQQSNLGFVAAKGDTRDNSCFHFFVFLKSNQGAGTHFFVQRHVGVGQRRQHACGHAIFAGKLNRADLQHLGAERGHFEHLFERDDA